MKIYKGKVTPNELNWTVTVNDLPLNPRNELRNHSPTGFAWGYGGSGPAQLALAILADYLQDDTRAQKLYQKFKIAVIAKIPQNESWQLTDEEIKSIVERLEEEDI